MSSALTAWYQKKLIENCTLKTTRGNYEDTTEAICVTAWFDDWCKPGNEPPPHVHEWEHKLFYVLEGAMEAYVEDKILLARAGEVVFLPQGKPHGLYFRSPHFRTLIMAQASGEHVVGLDRYFIEMAEPATSMELPIGAVTYVMDDPSRSIRVGAEHGIHILSPEETAKDLPHYPGFGVKRDLVEEQ